MGVFVSTWAAIMFLRIRRPVCSTLSILGMTLKMRATQASGRVSPHVEQAQPRQPRLFQQATLQAFWRTSTGSARGIWIEIGGGLRESAPIALT